VLRPKTLAAQDLQFLWSQETAVPLLTLGQISQAQAERLQLQAETEAVQALVLQPLVSAATLQSRPEVQPLQVVVHAVGI
jgi:hypothetical protein